MDNILQIDSDNMGGVEAVFYTAHSNIDWDQFPDTDGLRLIGDIVLKEGATWGMLVFTRDSAGFNLVPKQDQRGIYYNHDLKGSFPKDTPELAQLLYKIMRGRYVVLHRDFNGYLKFSGHRDFSLGFEYKYASGDSPSRNNAYAAGFKAESIFPAFFYSGNFEVTDLGEANPPVPGSGSGEPIKVMFNGEVVKIVQPGETLSIESEFTLEFKILI
ncbi:hypothetical protein GU926_08255 [Nibribacter ruber]|uniref:Uncharacterized protein n=1 Tax=Nibribacter ruber TaxID=2698458 RepID=A0A6P1NZK1_9BACT|nr:hypothetical protein [Nibribacter ruber]QHL87428.1 hypothetical protein GU926_08255 [Nibribacter ruber]